MKHPLRLLLALLLITTLGAARPAAATTWTPLSYRPAATNNPLKGFLPYAGSYQTFPHSMEWFYLPVRDVMTGPHTFNWAALEHRLNEISRRGHQAVFRFYLDYPGRSTGIPQYLLDQGLVTHPYTDFGNDESVSPDYSDPRLVSALTEFISTFGRRYDGDPRIGFITLGLIGFWGEWHTWPHDGTTQPENWMPGDDVLGKILQTYDGAFRRTRLLARYPSQLNKELGMGYHDDSFAFETLPTESWHFVQRLRDEGVVDKWQQEPVGGELRPEIQTCLWDQPVSCPVYEDFAESVKQTHASWLLNQAAFADGGYTGDNYLRALAASRSLGYELTVTETSITGRDVAVRIENRGTAPFYYPWKAELGAFDQSGRLVKTWHTDWTVDGIEPGQPPKQLSTRLDGLRKGTYTIALRVPNPLRGGLPLRFANTSQDDHSGWLTLGRHGSV